MLEAAVYEEQRRHLAAEMAGLSIDRVNRWAQQVARRVAGHRAPTSAGRVVPQPTAGTLTPREHDLLAALATGRTNREIAELLGMSTKSVMHHSMTIYRKLGVRRRAAATARAYEHGHAGKG